MFLGRIRILLLHSATNNLDVYQLRNRSPYGPWTVFLIFEDHQKNCPRTIGATVLGPQISEKLPKDNRGYGSRSANIRKNCPRTITVPQVNYMYTCIFRAGRGKGCYSSYVPSGISLLVYLYQLDYSFCLAYDWFVQSWCFLSTISQLYNGGQYYCGGNWSTRRKPPTCRKSLINFIT